MHNPIPAKCAAVANMRGIFSAPTYRAMRFLRRARPAALAALVALALAPDAVRAQDACSDSTAAARDSTGVPVLIIAYVHADALVFESDPESRVTLNGCPPTAGSVQSTLPDTIVPGVRYTNVEVRAEYRVWLNLECRAPGDAAARLCEELSRRD